MNHDLSDKDLWEKVVADNTRAFAVLYNRHWKKLYNTAMYYLKDSDTAEQILHDAFVTLWQRRKHLKIENFNSYIYVTTKYQVYKHLRAPKRIQTESLEDYNELATVLNIAEDRISHDDVVYNLKKCLSELPEACRRIFLMSRLEQLTNDEIAQKLGITKRTVENQITHALKHLRLSRSEILIACVLLDLL
ncbi:RNA polymerase sigma-70 factor (ECF subfamily) [Arcticibacter tournemirensis]|uniref:RNA polymerase sigma-70 factor n=1 Tax=Arcticibacter tournemirensis TaxID=699437 RepID=A0A5M9GYE5_9SPHI|nr:RNA polymerase sigma-70 factor [Arcticibacter tournemirensis]KAA8479712.1 RNA polymerase sigma-70 factor [Arcticibacter tournemirensis]TQM50260.1 RNA polymerase sigma-70 factor (ECF subfamily) [Arcticibacter tournemirensis]